MARPIPYDESGYAIRFLTESGTAQLHAIPSRNPLLPSHNLLRYGIMETEVPVGIYVPHAEPPPYAHRHGGSLEAALYLEAARATRIPAIVISEAADRLSSQGPTVEAILASFIESLATLRRGPERPIEVPVPPLSQEATTAILTTAVAAKDDCSITMTPIVVSPDCAVTPCGHAFNTDALFTWLTEHYTCPLCRKFCSEVSVAKGPAV